MKEDPSAKKELEEDHTRELEIENAYLTYQKAIAFQEAGDLVNAFTVYQQLSASSIIESHYYEESEFTRGVQNGGDGNHIDELSFVAQNVKNIRYLYLRNRGFLHLSILRAGPEMLKKVYEADQKLTHAVKTSTDKANNDEILLLNTPELELNFHKEIFYTMLDNLVSCMIYQEADSTVLRLLFDVYSYLEFHRLARFSLDLALSFGAESDDIMGILPINNWATKLRKKVSSWRDHSLITNLTDLNDKLSFLQPIKDDLDVQCNRIASLRCLDVPIKADAKWIDVIQAVNSAIKQILDREKATVITRYPEIDPYHASEYAYDYINFKFVAVDEPEAPTIPDVEEGKDEHVLILASKSEATTPEVESRIDQTESATNVQIELLETIENDMVEKPNSVVEKSDLIEKTSMRISRRLNPDDLNPISSDDILLTRRFFVETEAFFEQINLSYSEVVPSAGKVLRDVIEPLVSLHPNKNEPLYILDFLRTLNEWKTNFYDGIIIRERSDSGGRGSHTNSDKTRLIEVLTRFGNQSSDAQIVHDSIDDLHASDTIIAFLEKIGEGKKSISLIKTTLLANLLLTVAYNGWSPPLISAVCDWISHCELEICNFYTSRPEELRDQINMELALGIYEFLVDQFVSVKKNTEECLENTADSCKGTKSQSNSLFLKLLHLRGRIQKWEHLLNEDIRKRSSQSMTEDEVSYVVRYYWLTNYFIASLSLKWVEKKHVVSHLDELQRLLQLTGLKELNIPFPNYSMIGEFSFETLHRRLSTASILAIFSKILDSNSLDLNANDDTISLLEAILTGSDDSIMTSGFDNNHVTGQSLAESLTRGTTTLDPNSLNSVKEFLNGCPIDLRLNLWSILLLYYEKVSMEKYQNGFEQYLNFMLSFFALPGYQKQPRDRSTLLLQLISFYDGHLKCFLRNLAARKWILPKLGVFPNVISNLCRVFELSYCFSLHEESALITGCKVSLETKSPVAFKYFKDLVIDSISILLVYMFSTVQNENPKILEKFISSLIIMVHNQLGIRRLCESSNGLFLRFAEDLLVGLKEVPDRELAQILSCRFHYKVKLNGQFPIDHYTEKVGELDKESAEELANFILPFCFRRNPLTHNPRNDLKQIVEDLYEIIGDPDLETDHALLVNLSTIERFCELTMLSPRLLKEAFHGLQKVDLALLPKLNPVAQNGLYFMEAVLMFNFYKIRKKSAQSRIVELEKIVSLLHFDLAYDSTRIESWILLGQAYGFLVEDDLLWTSDKINILERKVVTANSQRKSLVSYLMAISLMTRQNLAEIDGMKSVVAVVMSCFTKELYSACLPPMDMTAFAVYPSARLIRKNGQATTATIKENPSVSKAFCLRLMYKCILLSIRSKSEDWSSYYYLGKIKAKLNHDPLEVLDVFREASRLAKLYSVPGDLVLDPAYKYFVLLYKYVKSDKISLSDAVKLLNDEPMVMMSVAPAILAKEPIYNLLSSCFAKIQALDKKGWYHKPAYRQAYISLHDFNDLKKAKTLMWKFFSLKTATKSFLQLWKPEHERPGMHFVYMYQYTRFYTTVLLEERDLQSLVYMFQKVRKANSTMVLLYYAWDYICSSFCKFIRQIFGIEENSVEKFLSAHVHPLFVAKAKILVDTFTLENLPESVIPALCSLSTLFEMRKLNNGFGPTSLIDDTFTAFFLMIYHDASSRQPLQTDLIIEPTNGKLKKLAKKDLFPFAIELTTKAKKFTDAYIKDHPNIFNEYVALYDLRMEQMLAMQQMQNYQQRVQALGYIQTIESERVSASRWWLFEQKLSMKKMLYSTIPDTKKLIQEEEDEIVEVTPVYDNENNFNKNNNNNIVANFNKTTSPNFETVTKTLVQESFDNSFSETQHDGRLLQTVSNEKFLTADLQSPNSRNKNETVFNGHGSEPDFQILQKEATMNSSVQNMDKFSRSTSVRGKISGLDLTQEPVTTSKPDEHETPQLVPPVAISEPRSSPVNTTPLPITTITEAKAATPVTLLVQSEPSTPMTPLEPLRSSNLRDPLTKESTVVIEEPNEPIFVPRRRSSRQRENLLKSRMNGLSKDIPIVVDVDDEGPKRTLKDMLPQPDSKRKKSK